MQKDYFVHSSSYIDEPVHIGSGTIIMHFCHLMPNSIIGHKCRIGSNVIIESGVIVGNNVIIDNNVTLRSGLIIEDNVVCGQSLAFTNSVTLIPRDIKPETSKINPTIVRVGANIGANSTIICGNNVGKYSLIGAGSVITNSVPNYAVFLGNPARPAGWACQCGKSIHFKNGKAVCKVCSSLYCMIDREVVRVA